jgi:hypothetical protein
MTPFFWDMSLHHGITGSCYFEVIYLLPPQGLVTPGTVLSYTTLKTMDLADSS